MTTLEPTIDTAHHTATHPALWERLTVALDDARVQATRLLATAETSRRDVVADCDLSDVFDSDVGTDGHAADRHHSEALMANARRRMTAIHAAYERMNDGSYGRCTECEGAINAERLLAVPETPWCLSCADGEAQRRAIPRR